MLAVLCSLAISGGVWGRQARDKIRLLYWQSRCMSYVPPGGMIVVDPTDSGGSKAAAAIDWRQFEQLAAPPGLSRGTTAYLHERISRSGNRRLVVVDVLAQPPARRGSAGELVLTPRLFKPGGLFSRPSEISLPRGSLLVAGSARIFCGQSSGSDAAHFTIRCEIAGREHLIDGWLMDDDSVKLEPRNVSEWARAEREVLTASSSSVSQPPRASEAPAGRQSSGR